MCQRLLFVCCLVYFGLAKSSRFPKLMKSGVAPDIAMFAILTIVIIIIITTIIIIIITISVVIIIIHLIIVYYNYNHYYYHYHLRLSLLVWSFFSHSFIYLHTAPRPHLSHRCRRDRRPLWSPVSVPLSAPGRDDDSIEPLVYHVTGETWWNQLGNVSWLMRMKKGIWME